MNNLETHITDRFQHLKTNVLHIACSGGLDSMTLLHVFHKQGFDIKAIHVNYQLRGNDSELDAEFVEQYCSEHKIPFEKKDIPLKQELSKGGNLQNLAREVRYEWFNAILSENSTNRVLLGHHRDDQIETFYLNLARKSGVMGLSCMLEEHNQFVRPFLSIAKNELLEYALNEGMEWREDKSNKKNTYNRNKLRNKILPELTAEIDSLPDSVELLIAKFQELQHQLENQVRLCKEQVLSTNYLLLDELNSFDELEQVELFRALGIGTTLLSEVKSLKTRGSKVILLKHPLYSSVTFEKEGYYFESNDELQEFPELIIEPAFSLPSTYTKDVVYLDKIALKGELRIRRWQIGDRIYPIGMKGSQLISDVIKDAQIDTNKKKNLFVVTDDENIHWCLGLKIARHAIATTESENILKLSISLPKSPK